MSFPKRAPLVLRYANTALPLPTTLPPSSQLLTLPLPRPLTGTTRSIHDALDTPVASKPFDDFLSRGDTVVIVTSDTTRTTLSERYLPILIDRLNQRGIPDNAITLLCALGIHRKQTRDEHVRLIGNGLLDRIQLVDHDAFDRNKLTRLGTTRRGTPVEINRLLTQADKVILTGSIRLHRFKYF